MSEMIERVAKALAVHNNRDAGCSLSPGMFFDAARAAIEAMREPTRAQLEAAEDIVVGWDDFSTGDGNIYLGIPEYPQKARDVWAALVHAALRETV